MSSAAIKVIIMNRAIRYIENTISINNITNYITLKPLTIISRNCENIMTSIKKYGCFNSPSEHIDLTHDLVATNIIDEVITCCFHDICTVIKYTHDAGGYFMYRTLRHRNDLIFYGHKSKSDIYSNYCYDVGIIVDILVGGTWSYANFNDVVINCDLIRSALFIVFVLNELSDIKSDSRELISDITNIIKSAYLEML